MVGSILLLASACVREGEQYCPPPGPEPPEPERPCVRKLVTLVSMSYSIDEGENWVDFHDFKYSYDDELNIAELIDVYHEDRVEIVNTYNYYPNLTVIVSVVNGNTRDAEMLHIVTDDRNRVVEIYKGTYWDKYGVKKVIYNRNGTAAEFWDEYIDWDDDWNEIIVKVKHSEVEWKWSNIGSFVSMEYPDSAHQFIYTGCRNQANIDFNHYFYGSVAELGIFGKFDGCFSRELIRRTEIHTFGVLQASIDIEYEYDLDGYPVLMTVTNDGLPIGPTIQRYAVEYMTVQP